MKFDMELEDILYTMKGKDGENKEASVAEEAAPNEAASQEELAPPKPKAEMTAEPEDLVWFDSAEKAAEAEKATEEKPEKEPLLPKLKKAFSKRTLIVIGAVLLAALLAFGAVKIAQYSKTATLKKYSEQYGVTFPEGIQKKYLDLYGENQTLAGTLTLEDTGTELLIYGDAQKDAGLMEKGSTVLLEQHYRAIALTKAQADLEKVYATADGYINSTQKITFDTLFGTENYKVIAAYYTNTKPEDDAGYLFPYNCYGNFTEDSQYQYQDRIKTRSLYATGYLIQPEDHCLTVSVESDIMPDYRFVIVGVRVDKGSVKRTKTTEENELIHYPQSLCDKKGIHNTYRLAGHWYPEIILEDGTTQQLTIDDFLTEE